MTEFDSITSSEPLSDHGLSQLREQIKNVMIPLLIKVFQLRLEVQQTATPPSRLQSQKPKASLPELIEQLELLDNDLKLLQIWNQSCHTQIEKVLLEAHKEIPFSLTNSIKTKQDMNPSVHKSFQKAMREQKPIHPSSQRSSPLKNLLQQLTLLYRKTFS